MNSGTDGWCIAAWALVAGSTVGMIVACRPPADDAASNSAAAESPLSLRVTGVDGYEQTLAKLRGKVVLVDFWATWCLPCLEQFPHTVTLHREYQNRGLAVIAVSLNNPDEEVQVRDFLARQDAPFHNILSEYHSDVEAVNAFGLPGPIPCYRVYDRNGNLRREFTVDPRAERQFTPADVEAAIFELL